MYPYDDNNLNSENPSPQNEGAENAPDDGSYRMVRPDAGRSFDEQQARQQEGAQYYRDANYTSENEGAAAASFYSPSSRRRQPGQKKRRGGMPAAAVVSLCLVCALVGGLGGGLLANGLASEAAPAGTPTQLTQESAPATSGEGVSSENDGAMSARDIYYNLALKQVVGINTDIVTTNLWGMPVQGSVRGSGFVISEDGYILTNYHVIEEAYSGGYDINVMFSSESGYETTEYTAEVIGFDRNNDVAVIKIDATGLSAATLGSSDDLRVGDTVYAVGNPLGELNYSMSDGMVSATDRVITTDEGTANMFQITAAVNEGNSGGPVYNAYGQVVGIVTARPSDTGAEGIGFAVPIDDAVRIADSVINSGNEPEGEPAYLGVTPRDVSESAMEYYNWPRGAFVYYVEPDSAADKAGIKEGDIITQVGEYDILSSNDLADEMGFHSAGETTTITVYRSGEYLELQVTFDRASEQEAEPTGGYFWSGRAA